MKLHKPASAGPYEDKLDKINDKVLRMVEHLDRLLAGRQIDKRTYDDAILDLSKWANARREQARIEHEQRKA